MEIIEYKMNLNSRSDIVKLYPIGDLHIGKSNCHEIGIRRIVKIIAADPLARWIGGGDYIESIKPKDPRFNMGELPNWMLEGGAESVRERLESVVDAQIHRFRKLVEPIKDKCVGLIEGNHEATTQRNSNDNVLQRLCNSIDTKSLTESAFIRFKFCRKNSGTMKSIMYIEHGSGGGRTPGAEPNHIARLIADKDADMICRGHSHTYYMHPPLPRMYIPSKGKLPTKACRQRLIRALNWGCYILSYSKGGSVYERRASYPARPLTTGCFVVRPFYNNHVNGQNIDFVKIKLEEIDLL